LKTKGLIRKSEVTLEQQVYKDRHLNLGTIVKVTYLAQGVYWFPLSGKKDTVVLSGEQKAIAISPSDS
jgi:hypothetical protein